MPLFAVGLQFLQLIPFVLNLINDRLNRRNINEDELLNDISLFNNLCNQWINLITYFIQWLRLKERSKKKNNPHTLIRLLAGYRYVFIELSLCQRTLFIHFAHNAIILVFIGQQIITMMCGEVLAKIGIIFIG